MIFNKIEDGKEDKIVAPVEIAVNKAVIEVDVRVNAEETHDESDKGTVVSQAVPNDATTDTANDDDSPDVIEDGEAQEASVALVEDWSTMLQLTWSPRGRRAVCLV